MRSTIYKHVFICHLCFCVASIICQTGAFVPIPILIQPNQQIEQHSCALFSTSPASSTLPKNPEEWKRIGEEIISDAICSTCIFEGDDVANDDEAASAAVPEGKQNFEIQWKPGKVIVTINADAFVGNVEEDKDEDDVSDGDIVNDGLIEEDEGTKSGFDIVSIARAINDALGAEGEDSIGYNIAVHHEIEVTTPGASDELHGIMFEAYKGFDVLLETIDKKKNKRKVVEGKLVERTDELTRLNCKGRMRKFPNSEILSLKLPKAKKEKGVR